LRWWSWPSALSPMSFHAPSNTRVPPFETPAASRVFFNAGGNWAHIELWSVGSVPPPPYRAVFWWGFGSGTARSLVPWPSCRLPLSLAAVGIGFVRQAVDVGFVLRCLGWARAADLVVLTYRGGVSCPWWCGVVPGVVCNGPGPWCPLGGLSGGSAVFPWRAPCKYGFAPCHEAARAPDAPVFKKKKGPSSGSRGGTAPVLCK